MRRAPWTVPLGCALAVAAMSSASADPGGLARGPLVLPAGRAAAELTVEVNLAHGYLAAPLSIAPDLWWGASSRWTVGLVHSSANLDRFTPGASVCVRQDPLYCDAVYRGSGIDARVLALATGRFQLAPRARALVRDTGPFKPALTLGALARWSAGRFAVTSDPYLQLGLANRDRGNRAQLWLPITLAVEPARRWQLAVHTGWNSELAIVRDGWKMPLALGVRARALDTLALGVTLGFASLLGPQNTPKQRVLFVTLASPLP